jgi:hypothetical protein
MWEPLRARAEGIRVTTRDFEKDRRGPGTLGHWTGLYFSATVAPTHMVVAWQATGSGGRLMPSASEIRKHRGH